MLIIASSRIGSLLIASLLIGCSLAHWLITHWLIAHCLTAYCLNNRCVNGHCLVARCLVPHCLNVSLLVVSLLIGVAGRRRHGRAGGFARGCEGWRCQAGEFLPCVMGCHWSTRVRQIPFATKKTKCRIASCDFRRPPIISINKIISINRNKVRGTMEVPLM